MYVLVILVQVYVPIVSVYVLLVLSCIINLYQQNDYTYNYAIITIIF